MGAYSVPSQVMQAKLLSWRLTGVVVSYGKGKP